MFGISALHGAFLSLCRSNINPRMFFHTDEWGNVNFKICSVPVFPSASCKAPSSHKHSWQSKGLEKASEQSPALPGTRIPAVSGVIYFLAALVSSANS